MIESGDEKAWRAGIYLRRSKGNGGKDGCNTIEKQRELLLDFANRNPDIRVVNILTDDGLLV